jgi:hypothetical protein
MEANPYFITWAKDILAGLKLPVTPNRMQFLYAWMSGENTTAKNNPLATTWDMKSIDPGQTNFNYNAGYPVKNYSTHAVGLKATLNTLVAGYYPEIMRFLKQDVSIGSATTTLISNLKTWGTGLLPVTIYNSWSPEFKKKISTGIAIGGGILLIALVTIWIVSRQN